MNRKVFLVIVFCVLVIGGLIVNQGLQIRAKHWNEIDATNAAIQECVEYSLFSWDTIVVNVPKIAGYQVNEEIGIRWYGTVSSDSPFIWLYSKEVSEAGTDVYGQSYTFVRTFAVDIKYFESEMALEGQLKISLLEGYKLREEDGVTIGFFERKEILNGEERYELNMFVTGQNFWVEFKVTTINTFKDNKVNPFAGRIELEKLVSLAKEKLLEARG